MTDNSSDLNKLLSDPSFRRWAEGEADKKEALMWDNWSRKSEYNRKIAVKAQLKLVGVSPPNRLAGQQQWPQLLARTHNIKKTRPEHNRGKSLVLWLYRVAAAILIISIAGYFTYQTGLQNREAIQADVIWKLVETNYAEHKKIHLTDGSSIILGSHSLLEYPERWVANNTIEVRLQGEAYFDITKKEDHEPAFLVKTPDGSAEVLGTSFVVDADDNRTRIVLETGAVKVNEIAGDEIVQLKPNEMAEFSRHHSGVIIREVNPEVYTSWTERIMKLDNTSFRLVADRLQKTFGVEVHVVNPALYDRKLTGTLNLTSADHLMNAVSEVLEIDVKRINDTIVFGSI